MPSVVSRRSKAITLAPLALISGVWTASLFGTSATAEDTAAAASLPDGTSVPADAIEAPASVPAPGVIAPAVPEGAADSVVSGASANGIPAPALTAYQRSAQIIGAADKSCKMPWELVAAIGRVESDHGRYGGNTLDDQGVSKPGIYGIPLDGSNGTAVINDTDGGLLDKDKVYDRAVGAMQFIPSTWQVVKVDADGDGERNPQDIDDAALASSVYLCSGKDDLSTRAGQEAAVYRYNRSDDYVQLVLRIMEAYSSGDFTAVPSGTQGGTTFTPSYSSSIQGSYAAKKQRETREKVRKQRAQQGGGAGSSGGSTGTTGPGADGGSGIDTGSGGGLIPGGSSGSGGGETVVDKTTKAATGAVKDTVKGVTDTVDEVTGGATKPVTKPVNDVITEAEARAICLGKGISKLDVVALTQCILSTKTG